MEKYETEYRYESLKKNFRFSGWPDFDARNQLTAD